MAELCDVPDESRAPEAPHAVLLGREQLPDAGTPKLAHFGRVGLALLASALGGLAVGLWASPSASSAAYPDAVARSQRLRAGGMVLVVALALDLDGVPEEIKDALGEWCDASVVQAIDIVVGRGVDAVRSNWTRHGVRTGCEVRIATQAPGLAPLGRLERLRQIRADQQRRVQRLAPGRRGDVVVVVDLDQFELPPARSLQVGVDYLRDGRWDVLCANGYTHAASARGVYDTFATILDGGEWMYTQSAESPKWATTNPGSVYGRVMGSAEPLPVRACFGGLGIYRYAGVWDGGREGRCDYLRHPAAEYIVGQPLAKWAEPPGSWCEHVSLLECVRRENAALRVGIWRELPIHWADDHGE